MLLSGIYLFLQSRGVQKYITDRFTGWMDRNLHVKIHVKSVNVALFNKIILEDVWMEGREADTLFHIEQVAAHLGKLNLREKYAGLSLVSLEGVTVHIHQKEDGRFNFSFLTDSVKKEAVSEKKWTFSCHSFRLRNSAFCFNRQGKKDLAYQVEDINLHVGKTVFSPDSSALRIESFSLADSNGFLLKNLTADITAHGTEVEVDHLKLYTPDSEIDDAKVILRKMALPGSDEKKFQFTLSLLSSELSLKDLACFIPSIRGMDQHFNLSGEITGSPGNYKAKDLIIKTGLNTVVNCNLTVSMYEEMTEPFIFLDLKRSQTDLWDLSQLKLPSGSKNRFIRFPDVLKQAGTITYQGNFTGFLSDFVAYGTISSSMGQIKTDLSFVPLEKNNIRFNGKLATTDFDLGKLVHNNNTGNITFSGMVDGKYNKRSETVVADFDGTISRIYANHYTYQNIRLNGKIDNKKFDGKMNLDDPNLKLYFAGELDLNPKIPVFDFIVNLKKADLVALKLDSLSAVSDLSFEMAANFSGNNLDNIDGLVQVFNGKYLNQNNSLDFANLTVNAHFDEKESQINLNSDYLDGNIKGTYHFASLFDSFRSVLAVYLPALGFPAKSGKNMNSFDYSVTVKNLDEITKVFSPDLKISTPFSIRGKIDSNLSTFDFHSHTQGIQYKNLGFRDVVIDINPENTNLSSAFSVKEFNMANTVRFNNLLFTAEAGMDRMKTKITWNNTEKLRYSGEMASDFRFSKSIGNKSPAIDISLNPSKIVIADSVWNIAPASILIDSSTVIVNRFSISHKNQQIVVNGKISRDTTDHMEMTVAGIDLEKISKMLGSDEQMKGILNGSVKIADFYDSRVFNSDLSLSGFEFRGEQIGNVKIGNHWDQENKLIDGIIQVEKNNRIPFFATGFIDPRTGNLDFHCVADNLTLVLLGTVIRETFSNFHGDGSGKVRIYGTPKKLLLDGAVFCKNAGLTIDYTQVSYLLSDSIRFAGDKIIFSNTDVRDITGNRGVFGGSIRHDSFNNMDYNLNISSGKILALNTTMRDNDRFYGKAICKGNARITGHANDVRLTGEITSLPETSVTIVLSDEEEVTRYNFVRFILPDKKDPPPPVSEVPLIPGGFELALTVHATPEARVQMIYNTQISDIIRAQGEGTLQFDMDKAGNIYLSGTYTLEQGDYLFTVQNVINKRFRVESGGTLTWSGDPYKAVIELNAIYNLKASLYDLTVGSNEDLRTSQRIPIECKIKLTGDLSSPDISFDIVFTGIESRLKDELQQYFSTQEDLNRQMLSLLVLGKFYTPEYVRGTIESSTSGLIGNTASDLFSNQLSNWLSQINKDVDIGFNYRPGNQISNDEIELALSTQILNDRVSINGNIANNTNPRSMNSNELVGDFEISVKLTSNGKLQLKAYNRSNNNLIYETAPYTQGMGLSYKENYQTFREFVNNFLSLFSKKGR